MPAGTVKFFIADRGFGFVVPDDGGPDVFLHIKEMHAAGIRSITEGQAVQFESGPGRDGKPKVTKVELVRSA